MRTGIDQRTKRVSALEPFRTDPLLSPATIVDRMVRLHACDHAQLREPRNVRRGNVLCVLDTEPSIAGAIFLCDALENVQLCSDRFVADGVDDQVQSGFVRA